MLVVRPAWGVCVQVTTTNQETGEVGKEPLMTLGKFRCAAPLTRVETCPNAMPHMRLVLHSPGLETEGDMHRCEYTSFICKTAPASTKALARCHS